MAGGLEKINVKQSSVTEFILWIIGYLPVSMVIMVKFIFSSEEADSLWNASFNVWKLNLSFQFIAFVTIAFFTIVVFKVTLSIFIKKIRKKIRNNHSPKISRIKKFDTLDLEKYSFFILSLMLPFIFESGETLFDLFLIFSLIFILIIIMIKMDQITVNPIFLFSKLKVLNATVLEIDREKKVIIITNYSLEELENTQNRSYNEYFSNVYFLLN
ncbi:hypothetical protein ACODG4_03495 [Vagococcus fluvialis]|uniref:hypothetical protein n=1 Tax=Vagococcus fluvialis TaxID=2738 RepID=UPI003B5A04BC